MLLNPRPSHQSSYLLNKVLMILYILEILGSIGILGFLGLVVIILILKQSDDIVIHLNNYRNEEIPMSCCNRKRDRPRHKEIVKNCKNLQKFVRGSKRMIEAFTKDEISEIKDYITFYENCIISKTPQQIDDFVICSDTIHDMHIVPQDVLDDVFTTVVECYIKLFTKFSDPNAPLEEKLCSYLSFLSFEAMKKGFESILTYVKFLKLSLLKKDGKYYIVSEKKQSRIKNFVHMNRKFGMKWGIYIEMAKPKSKDVWKISQS